MYKELTIEANNIKKSRYKEFVFSSYENIIHSIFEYNCVSKLKFEKEDESFRISFNMKISKEADLLWILIKDYLASIIETDDQVQLEITEIEQNGTTIVYRLYNHTPALNKN